MPGPSRFGLPLELPTGPGHDRAGRCFRATTGRPAPPPRGAPMRRLLLLTCASLFLLTPAALQAELVSLDILRREPFAGGQAFGAVGPYEKVVGRARFAVAPDHPRNKVIV